MIRHHVLGLASVSVLSFAAAAPAFECDTPPSLLPIPTAGNCVYDVALHDTWGAYTAATGEEHPVTSALRGIVLGDRYTLPMGGGELLAPAEKGLSVRSWTTGTDYRFDIMEDTLREDGGFDCIASVDLPPATIREVARADGQVIGLEAEWDVDEADALQVVTRIVAHGETFEDSAVEVSSYVTNLGTAPVRLGFRYFWDVGIVLSSFLPLGPVPPDPPHEPFVTEEGEWLLPPFDHLVGALYDDPSTREVYYLAGISVNGPPDLDPPPTPPEAIVRSAAVKGLPIEARIGPGNTCFAWEVPDPPGGAGIRSAGPQAVVYYWGRRDDTAILLAPGETQRLTVWFWAWLENPVTCDAGGPYPPAECAGADTAVPLDGSGSATDAGNPLRHRWSSSDPGVGFDGADSPTAVAHLPGPGSWPVELEVGIGPFTRRCSTVLEVVDTTPPDLTVPADVVLLTSEHGPDACALVAELHAEATDVCSSVDVTHVTIPDVGSGGGTARHAFPPGTTRVVFTARDDAGNETVRETLVTVIDDTPPRFEVLTVAPAVLWPPRHDLRDVAVEALATDNCDDAPVVTLVVVDVSEPDDDRGDGHFEGDVQDAELGAADFAVRLRAERDGRQGGRVYGLRYAATDAWGNVAEGIATVLVPHDRRGGSE
jgi:hypothetical protein